MRKLIAILSICLLVTPCYAGSISRFKTYSPGDQVTAENLNGNFDNAYNELNGSLDNNNADVTNGFRFVEVLGSVPASTVEGRVIYSKADDSIYYDDGTALFGIPSLKGNNGFSGNNTFNGTTTITDANIDGGNIDNTAIGASTPSTGIFSTIQFNTSFTDSSGTVLIDGILDQDSMNGATATNLFTGESTKAYIDTQVAGVSGWAWEFVEGGSFSGSSAFTVTETLESGFFYKLYLQIANDSGTGNDFGVDVTINGGAFTDVGTRDSWSLTDDAPLTNETNNDSGGLLHKITADDEHFSINDSDIKFANVEMDLSYRSSSDTQVKWEVWGMMEAHNMMYNKGFSYLVNTQMTSITFTPTAETIAGNYTLLKLKQS